MLINWIHRVQASPGAPLNPPTVGKNCPFGMGWRRGTFTDQRIGRSPCRQIPASLRGDRASSEIQKLREGNSIDGPLLPCQHCKHRGHLVVQYSTGLNPLSSGSDNLSKTGIVLWTKQEYQKHTIT